VASFAGFAPVSAPAISVAVVIDTPTIGEGYGGTVSAPVFAEVAQQVLEYLGVPHDQPMKTTQQMIAARQTTEHDDVVDGSNGADLNAMFADINSLPQDDPLRQPQQTAALAQNLAADAAADAVARQNAQQMAGQHGFEALPQKVMAEFHAAGNTTSVMPDSATATVPLVAPHIQPVAETRSNGAVVVDAGKRVAMPDFRGQGLRQSLIGAEHAGLRLEPVGSGVVREQVPAPGTMVPIGTEIVVRLAR
jgi:cell division protein FtsI (penicillin-binding protein 3)